MKCPHCYVVVDFRPETYECWVDVDVEKSLEPKDKKNFAAIGVASGLCPHCSRPIISLLRGRGQKGGEYNHVSMPDDDDDEEILYPKFFVRPVEAEVPERFKRDFLEACAVLSASPKASAALSRRLLQDVLREKFGIHHPSLAQEIDTFIARPDVPSFLGGAVDAVRNIGNFAAHPLKDTNTGEIVDVEAGEAEWLLDVMESVFDYAFVQPERLAQRQQKLNQKLQALGKPGMKMKK